MDDGGGASRSTDPAAGPSTATDVSLREHGAAIREGDVRSAKLTALALALFGAFAWSEIQRRLEILNHENARLLAQQEKTVSQDTYAANEQQRKEEQGEYKKWKEDVDRDRTQSISREEFQRDTRTDRRATFGSGVSVALVCIAFAGVLIALLTYIATH